MMMTNGTHNTENGNLRLIETDDFPFEFISQLAEIESWRKEVYRPVYHVHKWWAKRLGSVFRGVILASALPADADLRKEFYKTHDYSGHAVFDPFMGSGTTVGEAHKLGFTALGRDINPVACEAVRVALGPLDRDRLLSAYSILSSGVGERIRQLYRTFDADGNDCDALYYFWVKQANCPSCAYSIDLFSSYIFVRNAYPARKPEVQVYCPNCSGVFLANVKDQQVNCPHCQHTFDLHRGPANGASATCQRCNHRFPIAKTIKAGGHPPTHRMFAKLVLSTSGEKHYLAIADDDVAAYRHCVAELRRSDFPLPTLELQDGHNTRQVLNYAYRSWREFFNDRQLLAASWLRQAILEIDDVVVRDAFLVVLSGTLEFNNLFASYKGEGTGAIRHMFAHHILKPERVPVEGNLWGTSKSSGAFSTLFKYRLLRAIEYRTAPFEVAVEERNGKKTGHRVFNCSGVFTGRIDTKWPPKRIESGPVYLSCGDSAKTELPDGCVDLVVTDPPFFDNVHYSELADFFFAWQQLNPTPFAKCGNTTRHPAEVQDVSADRFSEKLRDVFAEAHRLLKPDGLLVFSYHHSRADGWTSLAQAVAEANFSFLNCHPAKAEMSGATPKSQAKQPINIDVLLVCQKREADSRKRLDSSDLHDDVLARAIEKAKRLQAIGMNLSANDRRVILIGQFLAIAAAGRSAAELTALVKSNLGQLDSTASKFLAPAIPSSRRAPHGEQNNRLLL